MVDLRKYPLSTVCIMAIWYLSFFTVPKTEIGEVPFIDKWVHIAMYGMTWGVVWAEYLYRHKVVDRKRTAIFAFFLPILMSGAIELLQEYCTGGRRGGDWFDLLANTVGIALAAIGACIFASRRGMMR